MKADQQTKLDLPWQSHSGLVWRQVVLRLRPANCEVSLLARVVALSNDQKIDFGRSTSITHSTYATGARRAFSRYISSLQPCADIRLFDRVRRRSRTLRPCDSPISRISMMRKTSTRYDISGTTITILSLYVPSIVFISGTIPAIPNQIKSYNIHCPHIISSAGHSAFLLCFLIRSFEHLALSFLSPLYV